jgi:UDP-2,3-diacylglucosamine pyrophosphatase LpxH
MNIKTVYDKRYFNTLKECVTEAKLDNGNISWRLVHQLMSSRYPDLYLSTELLRSQWRRGESDSLRQHDKRRHDANAGRVKVEDRLLQEIKVKHTLGWLVERLAESDEVILAAATKLQLSGFTGVTVWLENNEVWIFNNTKPVAGREHFDMAGLFEGDTISFAVVSDTHLGSKYEALDELYYFYTYAASKGITVFYHVGDISEGYYTNRPVSIKDTHKVGFTDQLNYIVDNYPKRKGITTHFITGNHDATHMRNGFASMGDNIHRLREDMNYLGHNHAKIDLTPNLTLSLVHPTDGVSKSLSLKLQNLIDANPARRADIVLVGHYHKAVNVKYRGVYGYLLPSFQHQTPFMSDNNIVSEVAGMIFNIKVDKEGNLLTISTEYVDLSAGKEEFR